MAKYSKLKIIKKIRKPFDDFTQSLPLPKVNPDYVSWLSVLFSIFFVVVMAYSIIWALVFLILVNILDILDGAIARRHNLASDHGYVVDLMSDRLSEGIIFLVFFTPWFIFFVINCFLTWICLSKKKHIILPLRPLFLVWFIWAYFIK